MGTFRLTEVSSSSTPNPTFRLTSAAAEYDPTKFFALTFINAASGASSSAVFRLTEMSLSNVVQGVPPVGDAGSDINAAAAETWQFNGSDSSSNGTIVARQWTQLSKSAGAPDLVLDDATIATPSFVAPILAADATYQFGYVVTEDTGLTSEQTTATVTVTAADVHLATATGWVPSGLLVATSNGWV